MNDHDHAFDAAQIVESQLLHVTFFRRRTQQVSKKKLQRGCLRDACEPGEKERRTYQPLYAVPEETGGTPGGGELQGASGVLPAAEEQTYFGYSKDAERGKLAGEAYVDAVEHQSGEAVVRIEDPARSDPLLGGAVGACRGAAPGRGQDHRIHALDKEALLKCRDELYTAYPSVGTSFFVADHNKRGSQLHEYLVGHLQDEEDWTTRPATEGDLSPAKCEEVIGGAALSAGGAGIIEEAEKNQHTSANEDSVVDHESPNKVRTAPSTRMDMCSSYLRTCSTPTTRSSPDEVLTSRRSTQQVLALLRKPGARQRVSMVDIVHLLEDLHELERELHKLNFQRQLLVHAGEAQRRKDRGRGGAGGAKLRGKSSTSSNAASRAEEREEEESVQIATTALDAKIVQTMMQVAELRQSVGGRTVRWSPVGGHDRSGAGQTSLSFVNGEVTVEFSSRVHRTLGFIAGVSADVLAEVFLVASWFMVGRSPPFRRHQYQRFAAIQGRYHHSPRCSG